ncbi:NADP-dependent malic enzyme [Aquimarina agarilytica]|uniref:NADP-dependent malic enzyme n=1 Tax=Aquimarina agarilytica TaxID=1087449 RepID=UPI00028997F8|nr:NADP-dependent malic enzyme [Aquimarina agarilytica]
MDSAKKKQEALDYHEKPTPGKIKVVPTKKYDTQRDLSLAYSPGVAEPCLEIEKNYNDAYKYTAKGNLVAVISNGTAVLGLGDIGAMASKPVMEGKGLLFKIFADIDVFDIEVDTKNVDAFIETVKNIAPTFGGINLEDIKAPEAFEIERRLKEELDIPVMHDDQHGTAIISAAALLNACELVGKKMSDINIVISGAGAAAISCTRLYKSFGALGKNIVMTDSKGVIRKDRGNLSPQKAEFATDKDVHTLEEAMKNADVFIGLSMANLVTPAMLLSMANDPIVFAMANPNPEIEYNLAVKTRKDIIMATGRSDHPNQVNNVLGFPFIFRGALDVRATAINEEMKQAAVVALAELAKKPVPEEVNIAYNKTKLIFGKDYIIPKPFDPRLIGEIPVAVAKAAIESGVAQIQINDWNAYKQELLSRLGDNNKFIELLIDRAKQQPKKVVYAEADQLQVLKAAQIAFEEGIAIPVLLGNKAMILELMDEIKFNTSGVIIIDPKSEDESEKRTAYAKKYWQERQRKGITYYDAESLMRERNYFGAMMVNMGDADALLSGYSRSYNRVIKPVLELIGLAPGIRRAAATNLMITDYGPLFVSDTSININPSAKELAKITRMTAATSRFFGIDPVIAMVSYTNFSRSKDSDVEKVNQAVNLLHKTYPNMLVDGPVQADFALNNDMLKERFPFSKLVNKRVNALVFPNLSAANSTYKLLKELHGAASVGPILMGMKKPVHILQLGASVEEIVNMTAVAVVDAQVKQA